ncbi:MAG: DUF1579 domain-containing protein [Planctomycetales bacterium]
MCRKIVLAVLVSWIAVGVSRAQEPPKPGPEHERLKEMVGTWDAVIEMEGQKSKGSATYKLVGGGMWLVSDFQGDFGGLPFEGHGVDGFDLRKKKYVSVWVDSMESSPLRLEGTYDAKTKMLTMSGESFAPDGSPMKLKTTTQTKDKDHSTFKMFMVLPDGKDQLMMTIEYTRKK